MEDEILYIKVGEKSWGGRAEHGILNVSIVIKDGIEYLKMLDSYYDDYNISTLMDKKTKYYELGEKWFENSSTEVITDTINSYIEDYYTKFTTKEIELIR